MRPLPLATSCDRGQIEALVPFVQDRACVVIGSAPLATRHVYVRVEEVVISVNGGISSVAGMVDLWVVNSKQQDQQGALMRPLHRLMLEQGKARLVRHALFLRGPKVASEHFTWSALKRLGCEIGSCSVLDKPTKRWIEGELCGRLADKYPCSSGILAAACTLWAGAASVRLEGFSLQPGYHYLPGHEAKSWWRDHVQADKRALLALRERYGDRLQGEILARELAA